MGKLADLPAIGFEGRSDSALVVIVRGDAV